MFSVIKNVSKHTIVYGLGDLLSKGIAFFLIPLYTHYLTVEQYGTLELLDLTTYIVGLLLAMGIAQSVVRYYYEFEDEESRAQVISVAMISIWVVTLAALGFLLYFSKNISTLVFDTSDNYRLFNIIFVTMVVSLSNEIPMTVLRIEQKSVFYVMVSLSRLVVTLTLNILLIVKYEMGVMGILIAGLTAHSLAGVFLTYYMLRRVRLSYSIPLLKKMLNYSYPLIASWAGMFVLHFGDRFLLKHLDTLGNVGIYALAYKFGMIVNMLIVNPFNMTWAPKRFEIVKNPDARDTYTHVFTYFVLIQLYVSLGIGVMIRDAINIVAETDYQSAYLYVPLLLIGYVFYGSYSFVQFGVLLKKKTKYLGICTMIVALANVGLNFWLIPRYSVWGATITTAISFTLLAALIFPFAQRFYHIPYQWGRLAKLVVVAAAMYVLAGFVNPANAYVSLFVKFLIALTYPLVLLAIGFFTPQEREKIGGAWRALKRRGKLSGTSEDQ